MNQLEKCIAFRCSEDLPKDRALRWSSIYQDLCRRAASAETIASEVLAPLRDEVYKRQRDRGVACLAAQILARDRTFIEKMRHAPTETGIAAALEAVRRKGMRFSFFRLTGIVPAFTPEDISIAKYVQIRQFGKLSELSFRIKQMGALSGRDERKIDALAASIERFMATACAAFGQESAYIRLQTYPPAPSQHAMAYRPFFHKDGYEFSGKNKEKLLFTPLGPGTLFISANPKPDEERAFDGFFQRWSDLCKQKSREKTERLASRIRRLRGRIERFFAEKYPVEQPENDEGAVFTMDKKFGAIHAIPDAGRGRIVVHLVPGSAQDIAAIQFDFGLRDINFAAGAPDRRLPTLESAPPTLRDVPDIFADCAAEPLCKILLNTKMARVKEEATAALGSYGSARLKVLLAEFESLQTFNLAQLKEICSNLKL